MEVCEAPCPLHGCKRVYTDMDTLETHIKDHEITAQSLPGKVLLCSAVGCSGSFPNMQELMEHMRHHHKPNIFFLCESCRTKLRSYRGLLTHLHTCSKVPRGKPKSAEPVVPLSTAGTTPNLTLVAKDHNLTQLDSKLRELPFQIPNPHSSFPAAVPQPDSALPPLLCPPFFSNQENLPSGFNNKASVLPPSLSQACPAAALDPPDAKAQTQTRCPGSAPHSPPSFSAVWKKNQGMGCNRRILWEHTKGHYRCVQCGHTVTNRKEMTQHISSQHSSNRTADYTGSCASNTYVNSV
uniref:C2H2-type domain-containing protein n=1 Tax=Mola mola TaxID=94237 RepID=A0A3Q3XCG0_MOLML